MLADMVEFLFRLQWIQLITLGPSKFDGWLLFGCQVHHKEVQFWEEDT